MIDTCKWLKVSFVERRIPLDLDVIISSIVNFDFFRIKCILLLTAVASSSERITEMGDGEIYIELL